MTARPLLAIALATALAASAHAQRVPMDISDGHFTAQSLVQGVSATAGQCATVAQAVWAQTADGTGECIRYWAAGLPAAAPVARVLVYIPSDQLAFDQAEASYTTRSPKIMQGLVDGMQMRAGVPFILLSRPGTFGSSGEHKQRRRELEPRLMSAALDAIKARHGIGELVLVGLSGGGHIVASLLGWRSDIVCAVPTSSVSSPRLRWQGMGRTADLTGYTDSHEPVDHLRREVFHPQLRVFVLGDPKDSNVVWATQTPLADRLKALGADVTLLHGEGSDTQRHVLGSSGQRVGAMCLRGASTQEIQDMAARGLKG